MYVRLCMFRRSVDAEAQVVKEDHSARWEIDGVIIEHGAEDMGERPRNQAVEPNHIASMRSDVVDARAEEFAQTVFIQAGKEIEFDDVAGLDPPGEVERRYSRDAIGAEEDLAHLGRNDGALAHE